MREELVVLMCVTYSCWITPAHAGRIPKSRQFPGRAWDHPRACGKNGANISAGVSEEGSPPRMREELDMAKWKERGARITPAHAGRMAHVMAEEDLSEDHPRACGKNIGIAIESRRRSGSPPRMREECRWGSRVRGSPWITPAHAGRIFFGVY